MPRHRRKKVERQLGQLTDRRIKMKRLDLSLQENRVFLWDKTREWQPKAINNYGLHEQEVMRLCIEGAESLGVANVCLFVDDELYGFCLYMTAPDSRYVVINHVKATHVSALGFELIAYIFAKWFHEQGVVYGNICSDHGLLRLRMFMLTLGPHNFFRKYIVEPAK